ncbi:MAG: endonuclease Q family protein [Rhodobacterales bacterium]|nr:endonuclease Q family protein [Rhodobacterales bacterium]
MSFLTACAPADAPRYIYLRPEIPKETLTPCPISKRAPRTVNDLAILATEHLRSAECANGKIQTIARIVGPVDPAF